MSYVAGEDFGFSFKLTQLQSSGWSSMFLHDGDSGDPRTDSRIGCLAWAADNGTAFTLYYGDGASQQSHNVTVGNLTTALGRTYVKTEEHLLQFIVQGDHYYFIVDGAVAAYLPFVFNSPDTLKIQGISAGGTEGTYYDDLALFRVSDLVPAQYEFFDSFDHASDSGFYRLKVEVE